MGEERGAVMWLIFFGIVPVVGMGLTGMLATAFAGVGARAIQAMLHRENQADPLCRVAGRE
jgi:hypothetical protein